MHSVLCRGIEFTSKNQFPIVEPYSGDIPELFDFVHKGKQWVMVLPHSVMQQKRLVYARNAFIMQNTFEAEAELLKLIAANTTLDGRPVVLDQLSIGELEVMKLAYKKKVLVGNSFPFSLVRCERLLVEQRHGC